MNQLQSQDGSHQSRGEGLGRSIAPELGVQGGGCTTLKILATPQVSQWPADFTI